MRRYLKISLIAGLAALLVSSSAFAGDLTLGLPPLDRGFQLLYSLDFDQAHRIFTAYEQTHPDDPMGPTADAAGSLFSEFHRLGVLESQFFELDKRFENRPKLNPDPAVRARFQAAVEQAEKTAHVRLAKNPKDEDALFSMTLINGLQSDYAALIEKHNMTSLHYTKAAASWANQALAVDPTNYDAHIAGGVSKYLVGSLSAPIRWLVRLGGVPGDKQEGIKELQLVAAHGHYLAPFADILLAIAYVREHDKQHARALLANLRDEYPSNPLFAKEIARLDETP
jgi:hypothetical protein